MENERNMNELEVEGDAYIRYAPFFKYAVLTSMLLWLMPIGLIYGFSKGFSQICITVTLAGVYYFIMAFYMMLKNDKVHNAIQMLLNFSFSLTFIYIGLLDKTVAMNILAVITGLITLISTLYLFCFVYFRK